MAENKIYATAMQIARYVDSPTDAEMYFIRPQTEEGANEKLSQLANEFTHPSCCRCWWLFLLLLLFYPIPGGGSIIAQSTRMERAAFGFASMHGKK